MRRTTTAAKRLLVAAATIAAAVAVTTGCQPDATQQAAVPGAAELAPAPVVSTPTLELPSESKKAKKNAPEANPATSDPAYNPERDERVVDEPSAPAASAAPATVTPAATPSGKPACNELQQTFIRDADTRYKAGAQSLAAAVQLKQILNERITHAKQVHNATLVSELQTRMFTHDKAISDAKFQMAAAVKTVNEVKLTCKP